jgi:PAS domain S-box-containing protein
MVSSRDLLRAAMKKTKAIPAAARFLTNERNGHNGRNGSARPVSNAELDAAVQRYVDLFDFAPIAYVSFDRVGRMEEINLAAVQLLGGSRRPLIGRPFALHVVKEDAGLFLDHLLRCRSSESPVETELHLKKRNGEVILAHLTSSPTTASRHDGARLYQTAIVDLTERKKAEEAIHESEKRYRTLFDYVPTAIYTCDAQGRIVEFNQRAAQLWGRKPKTSDPTEKYCGSFKIFYPDGQPMAHKDCPMGRVLRGEEVPEDEREILVEREDGERRVVEVSPTALRNERGKIVGAINCLYDITDRKRAEKALTEAVDQRDTMYRFVERRHEAKSVKDIYNAALDTLMATLHCDRAAVLLFDEEGGMRFVASEGLSARYRRAVQGHSPWKQAVRKARPIALNDVDLAKLPKALHRSIRAEGIRACAFIPLITEGKLIGKVMAYYNEPHHFRPRELNLALNIASQLALGIERKQAEEALVKSEEFHRALVSQTNVGMARTDLRGRFAFVNQTFCEMVGYKKSELMGKRIADITHPDDQKETRRLFQSIARKGAPYRIEKRYLRKDGSILWVSVSASPIRDPRGRMQSAIAVVVDITERKKAEAALLDAKNRLEERVTERTAKLRAANEELENEIALRKRLEGEILGISDREQRRLGQDLHDSLCQNLTAIAFMARAVGRRLKDHRVIEVDDIDRIADLINDGVTEARTIARGLHPVEMDSAGLSSALRALLHRQSKLPYHLGIDEEIEIKDPTVALHLFRIAREAVVNANKHARAKELVVCLRKSGKEIELSVTDDGMGPPRRFVEGPGMGFHIMEYRARSIGARLEITPVKPHGTCIACYLPRK